jgi:hypothetical protein
VSSPNKDVFVLSVTMNKLKHVWIKNVRAVL